MNAYVRPIMDVENFTANDFIAACGDSGKNYLFHCNADAGVLYYFPDTKGKLDGDYTNNGKQRLIGFGYSPCNEEHLTPTSADFYEGFVDYNLNGQCDKKTQITGRDERVIVWRGEDGKNGHATNNLDINSWETAKS